MRKLAECKSQRELTRRDGTVLIGSDRKRRNTQVIGCRECPLTWIGGSSYYVHGDVFELRETQGNHKSGERGRAKFHAGSGTYEQYRRPLCPRIRLATAYSAMYGNADQEVATLSTWHRSLSVVDRDTVRLSPCWDSGRGNAPGDALMRQPWTSLIVIFPGVSRRSG